MLPARVSIASDDELELARLLVDAEERVEHEASAACVIVSLVRICDYGTWDLRLTGSRLEHEASEPHEEALEEALYAFFP